VPAARLRVFTRRRLLQIATAAVQALFRPGNFPRPSRVRGDRVAIVVAASNVSLDLSGHTLTGPGGKQGAGIRIEGASGVRVFGGILTRFGTGVEVRGANNVRIEGLHIHGEDGGGPPPGEVGVLIFNSRAVFVERNLISRTFLGILVRGGGSGGNRISENTP
jgi:nitrous oxidase accessory protein NosD